MKTKNIMNKNKEVNMTQEEKKVVADLFKKVNAELTPEKRAELSGTAASCDACGFVDYHEKIDNMRLQTKGYSWMNGETARRIREILHRLVGMTRTVGGKVVRIGHRIVNWIFSMVARFPASLSAALLIVLICLVIKSVPFVGGFLGNVFLIPAFYAVGALVLLESLSSILYTVR